MSARSRVTVRDIAEEAGVHASTVSRALNPTQSGLVSVETREHVRRVAEELGYRGDSLARSLRSGRTNTLGVVVAGLGNPFIAPVIRGVENSLEGRGLMALVAESQDDHARMNRVLDNLVSRRVDAIIVTAARSGDTRVLRQVAGHTPVVLAVRGLDGTDLPSVTHDDERGGALAAEHLLSHGHLRFAQLEGRDDVSSFRGRARGFRDALHGADVELVESRDTARHPTIDEGRRLMELLLANADRAPTAVFAHNDMMAIGALEALGARGLSCPRDVAIVGYNDTQMTAHTAPPITTVRLPAYDLGRLAGDMAVRLMDDPDDPPPSLSLPPSLVVRDSTSGWTGTS